LINCFIDVISNDIVARLHTIFTRRHITQVIDATYSTIIVVMFDNVF